MTEWITAKCSYGNCVAVAKLPDGTYAICNTNDPHGPHPVFTAEELTAFAEGWLAGEFDL